MFSIRLRSNRIADMMIFYERLFDISPEERKYWGDSGFEVFIADVVSIEFIYNKNSTNGIEMNFSKFDVHALKIRLVDRIPEFHGGVDNMPFGMFCGPYEYPGGALMSVYDPAGNLLSFMEW